MIFRLFLVGKAENIALRFVKIEEGEESSDAKQQRDDVVEGICRVFVEHLAVDQQIHQRGKEVVQESERRS